MTATEFSALLLLATATSFTPGPNTTLSAALAANFGLRRALRFVCAVPVGWGLLFSLCATGLGALVLAWPPLKWAIMAGGVGYLLWLAGRLFDSRTLAPASPSHLTVTFTQGVLLQFFNIKAWMLALALVAGWITGRADANERILLVLPVVLMFGFASNFTYAAIGALLRHELAKGQRLLVFNRGMAVALALTALWILRGAL